jgi:hypothetical protein
MSSVRLTVEDFLKRATIAKKQAIITAGYNFVSIWESEWYKLNKANK